MRAPLCSFRNVSNHPFFFLVLLIFHHHRLDRNKTVFLKDMNDFGAVNTVYAKHMGDHKPARSTVEVARLPKDALIEVSVGYGSC